MIGPALREGELVVRLRARLVIYAMIASLTVAVPAALLLFGLDLRSAGATVLSGVLLTMLLWPILYVSGSVQLAANYLLLIIFGQVTFMLSVENSFFVLILTVVPFVAAALASVRTGVFWTIVCIVWLGWFLASTPAPSPQLIGLVGMTMILCFTLCLAMSILETSRDRALRDSAELYNVQQMERRRFKEFVGAAYPCLVEIDAPDRLIASTGAAAVVGVSDDELLSSSLEDLLHPEDRRKLSLPLGDRTRLRQEVRLRHDDGRWVWVECVITPYTEDKSRWLVGLRNIEDERQQRMLASRRERLDSLGYLAAGLTHDFNNLLTVILAFAESMPASPAREEIMESARTAGDLMRQLKVVGERTEDADTEAPVLGLINALKSLESISLSMLGDEITHEATYPETPIGVRISAVELNQVMVNLMKNAANAMPGGGHVAQTVSLIELDAVEAEQFKVEPGRYAQIAVRDTGVGMDAHTLEHALDPFFTTKKDGRGTGLGLANCDTIVRRRGGVLLLDSSPGAGTTVTVLLPVAKTAEIAVSAELPDTPSQVMRQETVLVLEDNAQIRGVVCHGLERAGFPVFGAESETEAYEITSIVRPDLLVADVILEGATGPAVARRLRENLPELEIVFVSGHSSPDAVFVKEMGARFLAKPFRSADLVREIDGLLAERQGAAALREGA